MICNTLCVCVYTIVFPKLNIYIYYNIFYYRNTIHNIWNINTMHATQIKFFLLNYLLDCRLFHLVNSYLRKKIKFICKERTRIEYMIIIYIKNNTITIYLHILPSYIHKCFALSEDLLFSSFLWLFFLSSLLNFLLFSILPWVLHLLHL